MAEADDAAPALSDVDRAFTTLAHERGPALLSYAYLFTGDVGAAEDLVQEALLKVFVRARSGFTPDVAEAYVRRAIANLYLDTYRRRRHWATFRHLVGAPERQESAEAASVDGVDLRAALADLAPQERASVVLRFYEDLTVPEVAQRLGISPGSVKRYLSNAMTKLERRLGHPVTTTTDGADEDRLTVLPTRRRPNPGEGS